MSAREFPPEDYAYPDARNRKIRELEHEVDYQRTEKDDAYRRARETSDAAKVACDAKDEEIAGLRVALLESNDSAAFCAERCDLLTLEVEMLVKAAA